MSADVHTTRVEVDISQALTAEQRLEAATKARTDAVRELAAIQSRQEREQIDALKGSETEAKRLIGLRREERAEAKAAVADATRQQQDARQALKAQVAQQRELRTAERARTRSRCALF